jgi:hypothetical protein
MNTLCELLKENTEIYARFLELEWEKYNAVIKDDVFALDDIVSQEEVSYLKMKGIEKKREKQIDLLGLKGKTLKEIIDISEDKYKTILLEQYEELNNIIEELQKINNSLKTVIEVRLRRIDKEMDSLGEKGNTYSGDKNKGAKEGILISKKI